MARRAAALSTTIFEQRRTARWASARSRSAESGRRQGLAPWARANSDCVQFRQSDSHSCLSAGQLRSRRRNRNSVSPGPSPYRSGPLVVRYRGGNAVEADSEQDCNRGRTGGSGDERRASRRAGFSRAESRPPVGRHAARRVARAFSGRLASTARRTISSCHSAGSGVVRRDGERRSYLGGAPRW